MIQRCIDLPTGFLCVPADQVLAQAAATGATPDDNPGVEMGPAGGLCSFDAFIAKYQLDDPALARLATIVRGADTSRLDLALQSAAFTRSRWACRA